MGPAASVFTYTVHTYGTAQYKKGSLNMEGSYSSSRDVRYLMHQYLLQVRVRLEIRRLGATGLT